MTIDCQNERPSAAPTNAVRMTVIESNLWALIEKGATREARELVERVFEQASGHTRIPDLDIAIRQTIEAQCVADPNLTTEGIVEKTIDTLNGIIGSIVDGPRRVQLAVWAAARLSKFVPTTFFQTIEGMENVVRMKPAFDLVDHREGA
jgi:hypothetical protein